MIEMVLTYIDLPLISRTTTIAVKAYLGCYLFLDIFICLLLWINRSDGLSGLRKDLCYNTIIILFPFEIKKILILAFIESSAFSFAFLLLLFS